MKLRYYQEEAIEAIFAYFKEKSGNPLVGMPTASGKSVVIGGFIQRVYQTYPGQRVMMLTHVKELITQNFEKLLAFWPTAPAGIYSAGLGRKDSRYKITYAGIASVAKKADLFGHIDLVLIDECHLVSPNEDTLYQTFLSKLREVNPYLKVIGFTATPYRLGLGSLTNGNIFTDFCYDLTGMEAFNRLVNEGFLSPLIPKRTDIEYDVSSVGQRGGEYIEKDLQEAVNKDVLTRQAVAETIALGANRRHWLIFATGIEHAERVVAVLEECGIPATIVHSKMRPEERDQAIRDFKTGRVRALVNNNILTTGFDFPEIDLIAVLRPTSSSVLWVQLLGRGTRPVFAPGYDLGTQEGRIEAIKAGPKQNCLILDFAGNTRRLGPINDPVLPKQKGEKGGGVAPTRICEACGVYNHASARYCINCGMEFPRYLKIQQTAYTDEVMAIPKAPEAKRIEVFKVDRIVYSSHMTRAGVPAMLVAYYCGMRRFREYICLEHAGYAKKKAVAWWRTHVIEKGDHPETVEEALAKLNLLKVPYHIKVWLNTDHPEVIEHAYTHDGFRTTPAACCA